MKLAQQRQRSLSGSIEVDRYLSFLKSFDEVLEQNFHQVRRTRRVNHFRDQDVTANVISF